MLGWLTGSKNSDTLVAQLQSYYGVLEEKNQD
jgi:hypothetical protein